MSGRTGRLARERRLPGSLAGATSEHRERAGEPPALLAHDYRSGSAACQAAPVDATLEHKARANERNCWSGTAAGPAAPVDAPSAHKARAGRLPALPDSELSAAPVGATSEHRERAGEPPALLAHDHRSGSAACQAAPVDAALQHQERADEPPAVQEGESPASQEAPEAEPATQPPLVSVVIPNWNGARYLSTCLEALRRQRYPAREVILVDNASTDDSRALVERDYPEVRLLALPENRGFAGAVNAGTRAAGGEIVALLNNDTEADPHWLSELERALTTHPDAGSAASKILLFDRRDTIHSAGDSYRADGIPANRGVWQKDEGQFDRQEYIFGGCGGAVAYRRALLDQVGLLDERFFFSCEDVDLAWRAQLAGWRCIYVPSAVVYHHLSATGGGVTSSYYTGRNTIWVLAKDVPGPLLRRHWPAMLRAQARIAWDAARAWRGAAARARLRGQLAGLASLPRLLKARRAVQATRRIATLELERLLEKSQ